MQPVRPCPKQRHRAVAVALLFLTVVATAFAWPVPALAQDDSTRNLLAGRLPMRADGVPRAERLTDGTQAVRGDFWKSDQTAVFRHPSSFVEWDLGERVEFRAGYLLGDNNDTYTVAISDDGVRFTPLWEAGPVGGRGLQPRLADKLEGAGRYVRLSAAGGDVSYAVSEVQLFSQKPEVFPPNIPERVGTPPDERLRNVTLNFGLALAAFAFLAYRGAPIWWTLLLALVPLFAGWELSRSIQDAWPVGQREIALLRGTVALVAVVAVLREAFSPKRFLANATATVAVLSVCASLAVACFFNLGRPQYVDHGLGAPSFVHNFDMRVYYPVAKYFKELRFDGLYQGSVAAYVDDDPAVTLDSLAHVQLRDLKNHHMTRVDEVRGEIEAVKQRFSPERWEPFKTDMRYFRENMGVRDYLGSMSDHGGNATPLWLTIGHFIFAKTSASNQTLFITAMLDPALLLLAFLIVGRTFGVRTMLVSMVLFGANDFYMFGTNWAGATLRHDWMAYLAFGLCALKTKRWAMGGAFLALSAMIRAFPAFSLAVLAFPVLWWAWDHFRTTRRVPRPADFIAANKPFLRIALGATVTVIACLLVSSAVLSWEAWPEWLHKVSLLNRDPHVNHVSWRGLIAGPDGVHNRILRGRLPVYIAGIAIYSVLVALASRRRDLAQTATLGLLLIPVVFHPANYYIHFIFLMPLVAEERSGQRGEPARALSMGDAGVWAAFLFVCAAQYWTVRESDLGLHFHFASVLLFMGMTVALLALLAEDAARASGVLTLEPATALAGAGTGAPATAEGETSQSTPAEDDAGDATSSETAATDAPHEGTAETSAAEDSPPSAGGDDDPDPTRMVG